MVLSIALCTQLQTVNAEEKANHFPSLESPDVHTALCNIQAYNEKITAITSKPEMTALDMVKVHELTYTLERAVNFLKATLENVSVNLEEVHKASEVLDQNTIKMYGQKYLTTTSLLLSENEC